MGTFFCAGSNINLMRLMLLPKPNMHAWISLKITFIILALHVLFIENIFFKIVKT